MCEIVFVLSRLKNGSDLPACDLHSAGVGSDLS